MAVYNISYSLPPTLSWSSQAFWAAFGYVDPDYNTDECAIWSIITEVTAADYCPQFIWPITMNAMIFIPLFTIWRVIFEALIHEKAVKYAGSKKSSKNRNESFELSVQKYKESYWKMVTNSVLMCYGFYRAYHSPHFWNPDLLFEQWPQEMGSAELTYYKMAIGYHGHRAIFGLFYEIKRKDFIAYTVHHFATVLLIIGSWSLGLAQHGVMVMCLHDSADVFLAGAKYFSYEGSKVRVRICFSLFVLSWIVCRVILFPLKVIWPVIYHQPTHGCHWLIYVFLPLLMTLLVLHVYWGYYITLLSYYMIYRAKEDKFSMNDPRSDDEGEQHKAKNGLIAKKEK